MVILLDMVGDDNFLLVLVVVLSLLRGVGGPIVGTDVGHTDESTAIRQEVSKKFRKNNSKKVERPSALYLCRNSQDMRWNLGFWGNEHIPSRCARYESVPLIKLSSFPMGT